MRSRKLLVVLAGPALVAVGAVVFWPRADRVTPENFARIKAGMTRAELEAILGPPGGFASGPVELRVGYLGWLNRGWYWDKDYAECVWTTDTAEIGVVFDDSGAVVNAGYANARRLKQSLLQNLVWRAKRRWQEWFPD